MRVRIDLAYDGTDFFGWARQTGLRTVQETLESTIAQVLRLKENPLTVCAGRTDAGVHARGQVIHVDLVDHIMAHGGATLPSDEALQRWLPRALPPDLVVGSIRVAPGSFDARFSALSRRYAYRLWDHSSYDPLTRCYAAIYPHHLNVDDMVEAAQLLVGFHDFAAFCRAKPQGTSLRHLHELSVQRDDDSMIVFTIIADAFCHSMVRSLVGALTQIGRGRRDTAWLADLLSHTVRAGDVAVMPACGLTLEEVVYPPDHELAARAHQTRSRRDGRP